MATNVYVDGFNLYYGCLRGSPYKWLDIHALAARLMPHDHVQRIRYFTARIASRDDPQSPLRQQMYLRALRTLPTVSIHYGHFLTHRARMPLANPSPGGPGFAEVVKTEEKGSDVNLATLLLLDAFRRDCETAVVISNDSDLKLPIEVAQAELGITVGVVNPHPPPDAATHSSQRSSSRSGRAPSARANSRRRWPTPTECSRSRPDGENAETRHRGGSRTQPPKRLGGWHDYRRHSAKRQQQSTTSNIFFDSSVLGT